MKKWFLFFLLYAPVTFPGFKDIVCTKLFCVSSIMAIPSIYSLICVSKTMRKPNQSLKSKLCNGGTIMASHFSLCMLGFAILDQKAKPNSPNQ